MSWDLVAYREITDEDGDLAQGPLGRWQDVKALVSAQLDVEWQGPFWCRLSGDGFDIEINVGSFDSNDGDLIENISFEVRGGGDPLPVIVDFCKRNDLTLLDLGTGAHIDLDAPVATGFEAFQTHRDGAVERAAQRHGAIADESDQEPTALAAARARAQQTGYLRDQPFALMEYTREKFCNNFVTWNEDLFVTGYATEDHAASWRADLDSQGFFLIPDGTLKAPGPPLWYERIDRIEVERDRPGIRVVGREASGTRRSYRIRLADEQRKQAFVDALIGNIGREHRKLEGVTPGLAGVVAAPLILAALVTAIGYWLFSAATAIAIAVVMAVLLGIAIIGSVFGKSMRADHYVYSDET